MGNGCNSDYSAHSQSRHSGAILGRAAYHWAVFPAVKGWGSPVLKGSQSFLMVKELLSSFPGILEVQKLFECLAPMQQHRLQKRTIGESYLNKEGNRLLLETKRTPERGGLTRGSEAAIPALAIWLHKQDSVGTKRFYFWLHVLFSLLCDYFCPSPR